MRAFPKELTEEVRFTLSGWDPEHSKREKGENNPVLALSFSLKSFYQDLSKQPAAATGKVWVSTI